MCKLKGVMLIINRTMDIILNVMLLVLVNTSSAQLTVKSELINLKGTQISVRGNFYVMPSAIVLNDGEMNLKGDLVNNGELKYTPFSSSSNICFTGIDQQVLGEGKSILYNVLFNNNSTILKGRLQIDNDADFTKGIINNRNIKGTLFFNELASHVNTSNISFVNGNVQKKGGLNFIFPTGAENLYRPVSIEDLENSNSFSTTYFLENSDALYSHSLKDDSIDFIDTKEYWEIKHTEGNDFVIIELARNEATSSVEIMNAELSSLHVVRWDNDKNYWIDEGGIVNAISKSIKTVSKVSAHGIYALATVSVPDELPIDVYNNLTPNGDGVNDVLIIVGIEMFPNNIVRVFNRRGIEVSVIKGYDNNVKVFKGFSNSSLNLTGSAPLPYGTYFYVCTYFDSGIRKRKVNYLYINKN